jgi:hypothetical protein
MALGSRGSSAAGVSKSSRSTGPIARPGAGRETRLFRFQWGIDQALS